MKGIALLATPATVTGTFPVVAPAGTGTTMLVERLFVGVAAVPLNVTELDAWLEPKFKPVIVTEVAAGPEEGKRLVAIGACDTVSGIPLLGTPPTVMTTLPEVAPTGTGTSIVVEPQYVGIPTVPLKVTEFALGGSRSSRQ